MPELPDVTVYVDRMRDRLPGRTLEGIRLRSVFVLRTAEPPLEEAADRLLADRALSRFLKSNWPRTLEEREGT